MVKVKNKKNFGQADKLHTKKTQSKTKRTLNPFEVHINKEKFKVLGKKSKNDWGLPGVSRAKALKKRKNTLGHELKLVNKTNTFLDKRIGEKNVSLTHEDKIMARFAAERVQQHKIKTGKQSIYNLAEEEVLTHRGQTLEEIEKFDDPRSEDEDDDDMEPKKYGHLRENFVADANFGGGILSRNEHKDGALSRKDLIEQLIIESKKRKIEKQKLKEETLDLTQKLDTEWKDLQPIVSKNFNKEIEKTETPSVIDKLLSAYDKKNEDYDKMMRELKFEPRGTPSDRLKSEDEIAKQDKDKLEKLEQDRLARMHGTADLEGGKEKPKHRSADDLDDGYEVESDTEIMIAYDSEGKALMPEQFKKKSKDVGEHDDNSGEEQSDDDDDDGKEEDSDNESGNNSDDSLVDLREPDTEPSDNDDEKEVEEEQEKSVEITKKDKHSIKKDKEISKPVDAQKKSKDSIKIDEKEVVDKKLSKKLKNSENVKDESYILKTMKKDGETNLSQDKSESEGDNKIKADLLARKAMMEKAAAELPFTYNMPKDYESLQELLENQPPDYQHIIVERIIKCNHPKLSEGNKAKLATLFAYLLQYLNDLFSDETITSEKDLKNSFKCFDRLACHFYDIAQMDPTNAKDCVLEVIKEKFEDYKNRSKTMPGLDTLVFFKLVSLLFPTSDLKHPIVTPTFIFMSHILNMARIKNPQDLSRGLFVVTLVLEFTTLSKRILPEAINFIRGVLFMCVPNTPQHNIEPLLPFKAIGPTSELLVLSGKMSKLDESDKMLARYLISKDNNDEFKIKILVNTVKIFHKFFDQFNDLPMQRALFEHHINLLGKIPTSKYPKSVAKLIKSTKEYMDDILDKKILVPLREENKKPKTLKMLEPDVEKQFSGRKKKVMSREKAEHEKLVYRHKKEMKGALREIRRDKTYIGAVKIKEKIRSDNIRKQKVKQIYSEASIQQGELNAMERSKKRKK